MPYRLGADALLILHLGFVLFALFGGLLVARWRGLLPIHLPAMGWAIYVELADRGCPLTHWEQALRQWLARRATAKDSSNTTCCRCFIQTG
ncbi:hypothetical protein SSTU70S_05183 [Stutzerimonas stutzeri]